MGKILPLLFTHFISSNVNFCLHRVIIFEVYCKPDRISGLQDFKISVSYLNIRGIYTFTLRDPDSALNSGMKAEGRAAVSTLD